MLEWIYSWFSSTSETVPIRYHSGPYTYGITVDEILSIRDRLRKTSTIPAKTKFPSRIPHVAELEQMRNEYCKQYKEEEYFSKDDQK